MLYDILFWNSQLESNPSFCQLVSNILFISTGRNPRSSWNAAACDRNHAITFDRRGTYGVEFYWCDVELIASQNEV